MDRLKEILLQTKNKDIEISKDKVEVVGLSIASCLNRAATHWQMPLLDLDYEILEKGQQSLFKNHPWRLQVYMLPDEQRYADLSEFSIKLGVGDRLLNSKLDQHLAPKNQNGWAVVRNYFDGVFLHAFPPIGNGKNVPLEDVLNQLRQAGCENYDMNLVKEVLNKNNEKAERIGDFMHRPENDSNCRIETSTDKMKAFVYISPPKSKGRHLRARDIVAAMKSYGIVLGFKEKELNEALLKNNYTKPILAAEGVKPQHGKDAKLDYKVNISRDTFKLNEDAMGKVDFKNLNIIENVIIGQVLLEKIPPTRGKHGYTLFNEIVEATHGKNIPLKQGKGTLLSEDGKKLIAQENGQAILTKGLVCVEPIYRVIGDVGPKTVNISFLGSVYVGGVVLDGFEIKAGGNIEIQGGVQKASVEASGDIVIRSGVHGGKIESGNGVVLARFLQDAEVYSPEDILVLDGIMRSKVDAGGAIFCNGRLARIVGGRIRAKKGLRTRVIGSPTFIPTEVAVGMDPVILSNLDMFNDSKRTIDTEFVKLTKIVATLEARKKSDPKGFKEKHKESLIENKEELSKLEKEKKEVEDKIEKIKMQFDVKTCNAKIHIEKEIFPGSVINILKAKQEIIDIQKFVTISYEQGHIKISKLEKRKGNEVSYSKFRR